MARQPRQPVTLIVSFVPGPGVRASSLRRMLRGDMEEMGATAVTVRELRRRDIEPTAAPPVPSVSVELAQKLMALSAAKGVSVDTLVRVALHSLSAHVGFYSLDTRMGFGKYATETVETVIRCDARYALWAAENVDRFRLGDDAQALLSNVLDGAGDEGVVL